MQPIHRDPLDVAERAPLLSAIETTSFIGRTEDIQTLTALLDQGRRIVTLVGSPGIGKTRVAIRIAILMHERGDRDVWFCNVTAARDRMSLGIAIARAVGVHAPPSSATFEEALGAALQERGSTLLVLDNFEQLLPEGAALIDGLRRTTSALQILVTSRETMRLSGEAVYELASLPEASELFIERARDISPAFVPDPQATAIIFRIVDRLDQIPLAIELAAARVRTLSLVEILLRLEDRFALLSEGPRDAGARHATLRAAIEWSWQLLDDETRMALASLSVFHGGFILVAAERVLGPAITNSTGNVIDIIHALRDRSLLNVVPTLSISTPTRFNMYESIREFAAEKLVESGHGPRLIELHMRYYMELAGSILAPIAGRDHPHFIDELNVERDNFEAIFAETSLSAQSTKELVASVLHAAIALDEMAAQSGLMQQQIDRLNIALEMGRRHGISPILLGRALLARSVALRSASCPNESEADCRTVLAIAHSHDDHALALSAQLRLGHLLSLLGKLPESYEHSKIASAMAQTLSDEWSEILAKGQMANALYSLNRQEEGAALWSHCFALCQRRNNQYGMTWLRTGTGFDFLFRGEYELAKEEYELCILESRQLGAQWMAMMATGYLGLLSFDQDRLIEAAEYLNLAIVEARTAGVHFASGFFLPMASAVKATLGDIEEAESDAALGEAHLRDNPFRLSLAQIYRGHLDLAKGRQAAFDGDTKMAMMFYTAAQERADAARRPQGEMPPLSTRSTNALIALRILDRALARTEAPLAKTPRLGAIDAASHHALLVHRDAMWFQIGGEPRADLSQRSILRAILTSLCDQHDAAPGEPIDTDQLVAAAWPLIKMQRSAALNRLNVALSTLRSMGLRPVLSRTAKGYMFNATMRLQREDK